MRKIFLFWVGLMILLIPFVFGEVQTLGTFKINECIDLKQTCSNCTYNNISSVVAPNSSILLSNVKMNKSGTHFNYSFCKASALGEYIVNGYGDVDGILTIWAYDFEVTPTGTNTTQAQGWIAVGLLLSIILISFFFSFLSFKLSDYNNLYPVALFFLLLSIITIVFGLYLGVIYSQDYLYTSHTIEPHSQLFVGVLYGLTGIMFICLLFFVLKALAEIRERKSMQKYGAGYNIKTKTYEY
jgi:hypothetical protein